MRRYGSIPTTFWSDANYKEISDHAKLLALYLKTSPHTNMLGCYRLPIGYIVEDLGWSYETVTKRLAELSSIGFLTYDNLLNWLIIPSFLDDEPIENPNQGKSVAKLFDQVPEKSLIYKGLIDNLLKHDTYLAQSFKKRLQTLSEEFRNQKQNQEQNQNQGIKEKQAKEKINPQKNNIPTEHIIEVFNFWKQTLNHPNAKLDEARKNYIRKAFLAGYTTSQLCEAITGCSKTPHNMGYNDRNELYDGINVIFKNSENIERFIRNSHEPPQILEKRFFETLTNNNGRIKNENFADKQYTQTPIEDIDWLSNK